MIETKSKKNKNINITLTSKQFIWYTAALVVMIFITFLAITQDPKPIKSVQKKQNFLYNLWEWFISPNEYNPEQKLIYSQVTSFQKVYQSPDNKKTWISSFISIMYTENGGKTWVVLNNDKKLYLKSIHFFSDNKTGWGIHYYYGSIWKTDDAGVTWNEQKIDSNTAFSSIYFLPNNKTGWAVNHEGYMWKTKDSGITWSKQNNDKQENLHLIHFSPDNITGWGIRYGRIWKTDDAGDTWNEQKQHNDMAFLNSIYFSPENQIGWAVGKNGYISKTINGGITWYVQRSGSAADLNSIHFSPDNITGWIVGENSLILKTTDGGITWNRQHRFISSYLYMLEDNNTGWIVGTDGYILKTKNGGETWNNQKSNSELSIDLRTAYFSSDNKTGWIVGKNGNILKTKNGGETWNNQNNNLKLDLSSIHFSPDNITGWGIDSLDGYVWKTKDSGITWDMHNNIKLEHIQSILFLPDNKIGWAVGENGKILKTENGGEKWDIKISPEKMKYLSIYFLPDNKIGWAVGENGSILKTLNGGEKWEIQKNPSEIVDDLCTIYFSDDKNGWILTTSGIILKTENGGDNWKPINNYHKYPAPWYYASLFIPVLLILIGYKKRKILLPNTKKSVKDILVSDRPLEPGDRDSLNFVPLADGISRFLRNRNTISPLTIAITGDWGMGKSSLMNLIKNDLKKNHFYPVFFNAWHHQQEEQLLSALLENIRIQAIPPLWHYQNWLFWLRLIKIRLKKNVIPIIILSLLFLIIHGFNSSSNNLKNLLFNNKDVPLLKIIEGIKGSINIPGLTLITSAFICYYGWKKIKPFSKHLSGFFAKFSSYFKIVDMKSSTGFRYKFASEFKDVTDALGHRNLVILIDDLDRCSPANVFNLLESVNFLTSSGNCFVIMGLAVEQVQGSIAYKLQDIAEYLVKDVPNNINVNSNLKNYEKEKKMILAKQYLEKLINMEIPVPHGSIDQFKNMVIHDEITDEKFWENSDIEKYPNQIENINNLNDNRFKKLRKKSPIEDILKIVLKKIYEKRTLINGSIIICLFTFSMYNFSFWLGNVVNEHYPITKNTPLGNGTGTTIIDSPVIDPIRQIKKDKKPFQTSDKFNFIQPHFDRIHYEFYLFIIPVLMFFLWILFRKQVQEIPEDSPKFKEAMQFWLPFILTRNDSPRSVKRFQNQVRYFAMRYGSRSLSPSFIEKFFIRLDIIKEEFIHQDDDFLPEDVIVALYALYIYNSEWIENYSNWHNITKDFFEEHSINFFSQNAQLYSHLKNNFTNSFYIPTINDQHRDTFLKMLGQVKMQ